MKGIHAIANKKMVKTRGSGPVVDSRHGHFDGHMLVVWWFRKHVCECCSQLMSCPQAALYTMAELNTEFFYITILHVNTLLTVCKTHCFE